MQSTQLLKTIILFDLTQNIRSDWNVHAYMHVCPCTYRVTIWRKHCLVCVTYKHMHICMESTVELRSRLCNGIFLFFEMFMPSQHTYTCNVAGFRRYMDNSSEIRTKFHWLFISNAIRLNIQRFCFFFEFIFICFSVHYKQIHKQSNARFQIALPINGNIFVLSHTCA